MRRLASISVILLIAGIVLLAAFITAVLVASVPSNHKPDFTAGEIKIEILKRVQAVSEDNRLPILSVAPFLWDEGYYINSKVNEKELEKMSDKKIAYQKLAENEQRFVFFYKGNVVADLTITREEMAFDRPSGKINSK